ncbi:hypothetical protein BN949_05718 [Agrobacterium tumefaciens]|nr:hypothetical protein BN949_05718 [Agrobacterium tumefaciens]
MQVFVIRQQFLHLGVGLVDVFRIARKSRPAERADALAEQRADVGRHEAGESEGVFKAFILGDLTDVVAVVEGRDAHVLEGDHRFDVVAHGGAGGLFHRLRIADPLFLPLAHGPALWKIAVDRVVGRGLVRDHVGADAAADHFRQDFGAVAKQADGLGFALLRPAGDHVHGFVQRFGLLVEIAGAQAEIDRIRVALDGKAGCAGHHGCERLGAAHAAEAAGQDPLALEVAVVMLIAGFDEGLIGALHDALGADIDP